MDKKLELEKNIKMLIKTSKKEKELKEKKDNYFYEKEKIRQKALNNGIFTDEDNKKIEDLFLKRDEMIKKLDFQYLLEKNIKNNINLLIYYIVKDELFDILRKYKEKKVGEKTKEKINEEMNVFLQENYKNIFESFSLSIYEPYTFDNDKKISFYFYFNKLYFSTNIEYTYYIDSDKLCLYKTYKYEYIEINKLIKYTENMQKDKLKTESKLKALKEEYNKVVHEFNDKYTHNNTLDEQFKALFEEG